MVRQGDLALMQYYNELEKKLTLGTNKIVMTHEQEGADLLNVELRVDALHAFKNSFRARVFLAQPKDLPSARALAREAEASIERSMFANSYAKAVEERAQTSDNKEEQGQDRNPHFVRRQKGYANGQTNNDNQEVDYGGRLVLQVQAAH